MDINKYSNPKQAQAQAFKVLGKDAVLWLSSRKDKKYMVFDPVNNKMVHFGQMGYKDYTLTKDDKKRKAYLARSEKIKGNWKDNPYSPNNLSRMILW